MILYLGNGKYLSIDYIAEIAIKGNEPCKIWIKTFDEKWHYWREFENHSKAEQWILSILGNFII